MFTAYVRRVFRHAEDVGYSFDFDRTAQTAFRCFMSPAGHLVQFQSWASADRFLTNPARLRER